MHSQVATRLSTSCEVLVASSRYQDTYVPMECNSLLTTGRLQVLYRFVASWLSELVLHRLGTSCLNTLKKSANDDSTRLEILSDLLQLEIVRQVCCNFLTNREKILGYF